MCEMAKEQSQKTLFVRNIPWSVGKEDLENYFSDYGPVNRCFIVQNKDTGKSRGIGYVTYTVSEDAEKAANARHKLEGRPVFVTYADNSKKVHNKKRKKKPADKEEGEEEEGDYEEDATIKKESEDEDDVQEKGSKNKEVDGEGKKTNIKYHKSKIVLVSGLPEDVNDGVLSICLQKLNVKSVAEFKIIGNQQAHVKFKCIRDAKRAIRKLHNQTYTDCMLQASQLSNVTKGGNSSTSNVDNQSRVIIRNLSFKCKEEDVQKAFQKFGEIDELKLPTNTEGKMLGFGFVQFSSPEDASKAIEMMNTKKIMGRPVAVDWAISKTKYEKIHKQKDKGDEDDNDEEEDDEESDESDSENDTSEIQTKHKPAIQKHKQTVPEDSEESDSEDMEADHSDDEDKELDDDDDDDLDDKESDEDEDDDDDDEDDDSDDDEFDKLKKKKSKQTESDKSDCDAGQTVFIRNLAFTCTEKQLTEFFEQFGELVYAKVVVDRDTDHSRGMGFVKYQNKESADKCLEKAASKDIVLQGRVLDVTVAVSRNRAAEFKQKEKKEKKDARNLHLAREGMIRPGTQDAIGLSKADLDKRTKIENVKRQKLKNLNVFISPLRLCVRNIPINVDEKKLKEVFRNAAGQKAAKVTECRIMRDRARTNAEGVAKSMGFGFVSFTEHLHALTALRNINNNVEIFGEQRRLIVEFSLENKKALEAKEKRKERAKAKQESMKNRQGGTPATNQQKKKNKQGKSPSVASLKLSDKDRQAKAKGEKLLPKGMPSHWGPKVRHKARPAQQQPGKKGQQGNRGMDRPPKQPKSFKRPADSTAEGPSRKQRKRSTKAERDQFDKLVDKYKNSLTNKTKWFNK